MPYPTSAKYSYYKGRFVVLFVSGLSFAFMSFIIQSCANRGIGPQGGPIDSIPPIVIKEIPANGTLRYNKNEIEISFNEYIRLEKVQSNVFFSPPPSKQPEIQAFGKKIKVIFADSLHDNTTYTINFGDAICDNNEGNILKNYSLCFSTGDTIDSLGMYGRVVCAYDLNPISDIVVGIHNDLSDTAFFTKPFTRIGKTDEYGMFSITNIRPGRYKIYALNDINKDFKYQLGEDIAFLDSIFIPSIEVREDFDTLYKRIQQGDSFIKTIDTIIGDRGVYQEPSDVVLFLFRADQENKYFRRATRKSKNSFQLFFSSFQDDLPRITALQPHQADSTLHSPSYWIDWTSYLIANRNKTGDTITYWITDSIAMFDTLYFSISYLRTDSNRDLNFHTDTLSLSYRPPKLNNRVLNKLKQKEIDRKVNIKSNAKEHFGIDDTLMLFFDIPVVAINREGVHLKQRIDTTEINIPFDIMAKDESKMEYMIKVPLRSGEIYYLNLDSGCVSDIYGHVNDKFKTDLKVKSIEEYATLNIILKHYEPTMRIQLLDEKENVVRDIECLGERVQLVHLLPNSYYLRLYYDTNGDGRYTPGDFKEKRQPETVIYFPSKLSLRANWDFEEVFDPKVISQLQSKPIAIVKDAKEYINKKSNSK